MFNEWITIDAREHELIALATVAARLPVDDVYINELEHLPGLDQG